MIKRTGERSGRTPNAVLVVAVLGLSLALGTHVAPTPVEAAVTPGCVVDVTDMIGWWRGQNDLVGATGPQLTGTVPFVDGMVGRGMSFDGTSVVGTDVLPTVSTAVTVETWVKPAATGFSGLTQALLSRWDFPSTDDHARVFELLLDAYGNLVWSTDESGAQRPVELRARRSCPAARSRSHQRTASTSPRRAPLKAASMSAGQRRVSRRAAR